MALENVPQASHPERSEPAANETSDKVLVILSKIARGGFKFYPPRRRQRGILTLQNNRAHFHQDASGWRIDYLQLDKMEVSTLRAPSSSQPGFRIALGGQPLLFVFS